MILFILNTFEKRKFDLSIIFLLLYRYYHSIIHIVHNVQMIRNQKTTRLKTYLYWLDLKTISEYNIDINIYYSCLDHYIKTYSQ